MNIVSQTTYKETVFQRILAACHSRQNDVLFDDNLKKAQTAFVNGYVGFADQLLKKIGF